jgi:hypothetical protein
MQDFPELTSISTVSMISSIGVTKSGQCTQYRSTSARVKALTPFAMMAGTLQLSRALTDRELSDAILDEGIRNVLALFDAQS